jgi:hypothetical protein
MPIGQTRVEAPSGEQWTDYHLFRLPDGFEPRDFIRTQYPAETYGNAVVGEADFAIFPPGDQMVVRRTTELQL